MTKEEAIKYIDGLHVVPCEQLKEFCDERNEAIDMAIEALQADAVQGKWNTGKPTKGGKYIVTLIGIGDYRFVDIMHYDKPCMPNKEVSGACWYRDDDEWGDVVYDDKDIIAWIPLPKPYTKGDNDEER